MAGLGLHDDCYMDFSSLQQNSWPLDYSQYLRIENERLRGRILELELGNEQEGERALQRINMLEKELRTARAEKDVMSTQLKGVLSEMGSMEQRLQTQDQELQFGKQDTVIAQIGPCLQSLVQLVHTLDIVVKQVGPHHSLGQTLGTLHMQIVQALEHLQVIYKGSMKAKLLGRMQQLQALSYALSVSSLPDNNLTELTRISPQLSAQLSPDRDVSHHLLVSALHNARGRSLDLGSSISLRGLSPMSARVMYDQAAGPDPAGSFCSSPSEISMSSLPESPSSLKSVKEVVQMDPARLRELAAPALVMQCAWRAAWVRCKYNRLRREVFVGNLPIKEQVYEEELKESFSAAGEVETVAVMRNTTGSRGQVGLCRGFGFVRYNNVEDAYNALKMLQGVRFRSRTLRVDRATWRT